MEVILGRDYTRQLSNTPSKKVLYVGHCSSIYSETQWLNIIHHPIYFSSKSLIIILFDMNYYGILLDTQSWWILPLAVTNRWILHKVDFIGFHINDFLHKLAERRNIWLREHIQNDKCLVVEA
ncbi:hypothetical protein ACJX0J_037413, partial [Zea mays]